MSSCPHGMPPARGRVDCMEDDGLSLGAELAGREVIHSTADLAAVEATVREFEENGCDIHSTTWMRRASFGPCQIEFWLDHKLRRRYAIGDDRVTQQALNQA